MGGFGLMMAGTNVKSNQVIQINCSTQGIITLDRVIAYK